MRAMLATALAAAALVLGIPSTAVGGEPVTQRNFEIGVTDLTTPTDNSCVVADVRIDILAFLPVGVAQVPEWTGNWLNGPSLGFYDQCADQWLQILSPLDGPFSLSGTEFSISPSGQASLNTTESLFDSNTQSFVPVTYDLVWMSNGSSGTGTTVTGTVATGTYTAYLNEVPAAFRRCLFLVNVPPQAGYIVPACVGQ